MFDFLKKLFGRADVNKDGVVDTQDAKVVVNATRAAAKGARNQAKKTVARAQKSAAKKSKPQA